MGGGGRRCGPASPAVARAPAALLADGTRPRTGACELRLCEGRWIYVSTGRWWGAYRSRRRRRRRRGCAVPFLSRPITSGGVGRPLPRPCCLAGCGWLSAQGGSIHMEVKAAKGAMQMQPHPSPQFLVPLRLSPVHRLPLAPATSALASTLAPAAPVC
jgi:hypothetical protein